mmetsp:Transcript_101817/g.285380  ORF Transcript_101817/g.285380 Transcript_101817/m.285380 type:complete len:230 (+) Transcript_101817:779-1468(+)
MASAISDSAPMEWLRGRLNGDTATDPASTSMAWRPLDPSSRSGDTSWASSIGVSAASAGAAGAPTPNGLRSGLRGRTAADTVDSTTSFTMACAIAAISSNLPSCDAVRFICPTTCVLGSTECNFGSLDERRTDGAFGDATCVNFESRSLSPSTASWCVFRRFSLNCWGNSMPSSSMLPLLGLWSVAASDTCNESNAGNSSPSPIACKCTMSSRRVVASTRGLENAVPVT